LPPKLSSGQHGPDIPAGKARFLGRFRGNSFYVGENKEKQLCMMSVDPTGTPAIGCNPISKITHPGLWTARIDKGRVTLAMLVPDGYTKVRVTHAPSSAQTSIHENAIFISFSEHERPTAYLSGPHKPEAAVNL